MKTHSATHLASASIERPGLVTFQSFVRDKQNPINACVELCISLFKRRQICGARDCAIATAYLLRKIITTTEATVATILLHEVRDVGRRLIEAQRKELVIGNVVGRILGLLRDEIEEDRGHSSLKTGNAQSLKRSNRSQSSSETLIMHERTLLSLWQPAKHDLAAKASSDNLPNIPALSPGSTEDMITNNVAELCAEILEGIEELLDEIRQADDQIAGYALESIHPNEVIMVYSPSKTVQRFLMKAATKRKFTVLCIEGMTESPATISMRPPIRSASQTHGSISSLSLVKSLGTAGITVLTAPHSAIVAMMPKVDKVVLDTHGLFSEGTFVGSCGTNDIIKVAEECRVPVLVLTAAYNISPVYPFDAHTSSISCSPSRDSSNVMASIPRKIELVHANIELTSSKHINQYITNLGGSSASSIHRIIGDHYRSEDLEFLQD